jgi:hypothetical protein
MEGGRIVFVPKKISFPTIVLSFLLIPYVVSAQTYFQDDFSQGSSKWVDIWGEWAVEDGAYHQSMVDDNCMSVVADEFWQEEWTEYTIMFRLHGALEPRGRALRDLPPRMDAQTPRTEYWWNLGGWGNTRSVVERWIDGVRIEQGASNHVVVEGEWHDIKIENRVDGYTLYFDGEKVADVADSDVQGGRIGLASWLTNVLLDDVVVYGAMGATAVAASGKLPVKWGLIKSVY